MIYLYNKLSQQQLSAISEADRDFLVAQLEEEDRRDQDYFIDQDVLDFLAQQGASAGLLSCLGQALADSDGIEVRWSEQA